VPGPALLVTGRWVLTDPRPDALVDGGAVLVRDGLVAEIGPPAALRSSAAAAGPFEEIGSADVGVVPGFVNAHHHQGVTPFQRGVGDDSLEPWIVRQIGAPPLDPELDTLHGALEMIAAGVTTVMHNHMPAWLPRDRPPLAGAEAILDAYARAGMRVAFSLSWRDQHLLTYGDDEAFRAGLPPDLAAFAAGIGPGPLSAADHLDLLSHLHDVRTDDRTRVFFSPHNVHWCSDDMLLAIDERARALGTGVHLHLQETPYQVAYARRRWGTTPLGHLDDLGVLGPHVSCAHGVWLDDADVDRLVATGTVLCHNPSSNLRLKSGVAPLRRLLLRGVTTALGIDASTINDDQDVLQEVRLALHLHRVPGVTAAAPRPHDVLAMATTGGAAATGVPGVGRLAVGGPADLVLIDLTRLSAPFLHPDVHPLDAVVHRARGTDVRTVVIAGRIVYRDGEFTEVDAAEVRARLAESLQRSVADPDLTRRADLSARLSEHVRSWFADWHPDPT
jgi:cytosine/adenosine deaminase-related metal-dependent hydrolase